MEGGLQARQSLPLVAALGLLLAGTLVYAVGRGAFGVLGGSLPDFTHAGAFAILTAVALGPGRGAAWIGAAAWGLVASAFELTLGTFDPADLAAIAMGCAAAVLIVRAGRPGPPRRAALAPVLALGGLTTLGSYGPHVDVDVACTVDPPPAILSSPPTTASVGQAYVYYVDARWGCFFGVCNSVDGVTLPPGAVIDDFYDSVSWMPPPDVAGSDVRFVIETEPDFCGNSVRQSWTVHVYAAPTISSFTANPDAVAQGATTQLLGVFSGTGYVEGLGSITSGVALTTPPVLASRDFTLVVANTAGAQVRQSAHVRLLQPPVIGSISAAPTTVTPGTSATLSWTASGDYSVARIEPPGIDVIGLTSVVVTPAATTTYVLNLANAAGASASAGVVVTVIPAPVIDSFTATPASVLLRGDVALTAQFHDGAAELQADRGYGLVSLGEVTAGVPIADAGLMRTTTYRLTVSNAAAAVMRELTVAVTGPGTFQPTAGPPNRPQRARHTATRLTDGRVLIAGDWMDTELFDPDTGTFSAGPSLPEHLDDMAAALLPDGRVLLVGGYLNDDTRSREAWLYDAGANALEALGPLPVGDLVTPRAVTLADGRVLIVHPSLQQGSEVFDAAAETFSATAGPLLVAHGCINLERLPDGRVAVIEGDGASEIFTPGPDTFAPTGALGTTRCRFTTAPLPDGRVLVTGGSAAAIAAEVLDPATGLFAVVGSQAYPPNSGATGTPLAGGVLVVGGVAVLPGTSGAFSPMAELFDPASGTFTMTGGLTDARHNHTATLLEDGRVLVVGGCPTAPCAAELYTPP